MKDKSESRMVSYKAFGKWSRGILSFSWHMDLDLFPLNHAAIDVKRYIIANTNDITFAGNSFLLGCILPRERSR
jgi:hypothetical protein